VDAEVVGLDEGGPAFRAEMVLGQLDSDVSVENVGLQLALRRERTVAAIVANKRSQPFVDSLKKGHGVRAT
jgi:hypothetical protein